jgi:uncharacterized protein (TIGR00661 family)
MSFQNGCKANLLFVFYTENPCNIGVIVFMVAKKILIAPLDWGLGHATRCIPIVRELLLAGHEVIIAADGNGEHILREEFPELQFIKLEGYRLSYSKSVPAWLKIILQLPKIMGVMRREHAALKKIIDEHQIGVVISDNRFGLWNKKVKTIYVTHQLMIKCPRGFKLFEPALHALHKMIIRKYDHCWVPDYPGTENLSGDLSHKYSLPPNAEFIGPLSRFEHGKKHDIEYDLCIILSGPEPSRTSFEKKVWALLENYKGKCIVILGRPGHHHSSANGHIKIFSHLNSDVLEKAILSSRFVICRSGYSGIMDLVALKKDALLVPTPGQTEQEYLAENLSAKRIFQFVTQKEFTLENLKVKDFSIDMNFERQPRLRQAISKSMGFLQKSPA